MNHPRPELEYEEERYGILVRAVDGRAVARFYASNALSIEEAEEASERFTGWYHALPGGMNHPVPVPSINQAIRQALIERGWAIDVTAVENKAGELREFVHPINGRRLAWLDAVLAQQDREIRAEEPR